MYVMTWGDFCLMSRGRGEKSNNKTSRGSFDLGRLAPPGPVGGGVTRRCQTTARSLEDETANRQPTNGIPSHAARRAPRAYRRL